MRPGSTDNIKETARPDLSIVILSWNTRELLLKCLAAVEGAHAPPSRETIVVDNASRDGSADAVAERFPNVRLIRNLKNEGYARGNNIGIRASAGRNVLLLNSDTEAAPRAFRALVNFLDAHPEYGAAAARLWNRDGTIQRACMRFPTLFTALFYDARPGRWWPNNYFLRRHFCRDFDHIDSRDVQQPPGAALCLRRDALEKVGLLDEELFLFFNDVELCQRMRAAGFRIRYLADANIIHHGGASTSLYPAFAAELFRNKIAYYRKRYGSLGESLMRSVTRWRAREEKDALRAQRLDPGILDASCRGVDLALATALRRDSAGLGVVSELANPTVRVN
ncbi:MAG: glycosyltransferase family 2 protein [Planctomycetes bacterium]|nr:glycosyltransferase family 2 protein [Planctomycetota bacterium]